MNAYRDPEWAETQRFLLIGLLTEVIEDEEVRKKILDTIEQYAKFKTELALSEIQRDVDKLHRDISSRISPW